MEIGPERRLYESGRQTAKPSVPRRVRCFGPGENGQRVIRARIARLSDTKRLGRRRESLITIAVRETSRAPLFTRFIARK